MMRFIALLVVCGLCATAAANKKKKQAKAPISSSAAQKWLKAMKPRERAAQLLMVQFYGESPNARSKAYREYVELVRDLKVGGLIVLNRVQNGIVKRAEPYQMAAFLNRMQKLAKVPLIVGGDFERGASMRMNSTTLFPHLMAYGAANDLEATRALGRATARESRALGVHWVFAPDADVNNNPDNPIINIRSFSENPETVGEHVKAFIEGAQSDPQYPVLTTAKHFPGHGDTATDTHIGLATISATRERMEKVELAPFRAAIAAGVDSVMTAHLAVPALEPEQIPATVSKAIITGILREEMGFKGLITTDAMDMQGLSKLFPPGEAAVRALEAGVDLLLIPTNARASVDAIMAAVKSGRLTQKRIDESVLKILNAKVRVGLNRKKLVDVEAISDLIESPEDEETAQLVAEKALTLVKNQGELLPLREPASACFYLLAVSRFSTQGRDMLNLLQARAPKAKTVLLDPDLPAAEFQQLAAETGACSAVVVAAYVTSGAFRGNVALSGNYPAFVDQLLASGRPVVFVALGNPYLLRAYPAVQAYLAAFSTVLPSETAAVRALFGQIAVRGKLPVTIPGLAEYGFGLKMEARQ